ncbi:MAG: VPLPA-CTERM sorting domain-containing protein [Paracoccaceae bacterium]
MKTKILASIGALVVSAGMSLAGTVVLQDDFSSYGPTTVVKAPNSLFGGAWSTTSGTIDYLTQSGAWAGLCVGGGHCIDLDGSTGNAGIFSAGTFAAGSYQLDLSLFGSGRGTTESVTVSLGSWSITISPITSAQDASGSWSFYTSGGALSFANAGGDNVGAILSSVTLSAVPIPATGLLLFGALGGLGLARRRRKTA